MAFLSMLLSSNISCKAIPAICMASCHTRLISHDCWYKISVSSEAVLTCSSIDIAILSSFDNLTMVDRTEELSPFCHILIALVMPCISFPSPFCSLTWIICTRDHSSQASVPWLDFSYFFSPGACPFWMMLLLWIDPYDPRVIWRTPNTSWYRLFCASVGPREFVMRPWHPGLLDDWHISMDMRIIYGAHR